MTDTTQPMTDRQIQSLRNIGNGAEDAANEITRLRVLCEEAAVTLDLYHAYGWTDRMGLRVRLRAHLTNDRKVTP